MTEKDVGVVCTVLDLRMSEGAVQSLTTANLWWLPDIQYEAKQRAIGCIRKALIGFDGVHHRLLAIASLYCCLVEKEVLECWHLYSFCSVPSTVIDRFSLPDKMAHFLKQLNNSTVCEKIEREDTVYACIMTAQAPPPVADHNVICLCIPRTLPFVFVHVLAKNVTFRNCLQRAFGRPIKDLQAGQPVGDLGKAIVKARQMYKDRAAQA